MPAEDGPRGLAHELADPWNELVDEHRVAFAQVELYRARCARAEGAIVALLVRLDQGGGPAAVLADLGELLDEWRPLPERTGGGTDA